MINRITAGGQATWRSNDSNYPDEGNNFERYVKLLRGDILSLPAGTWPVSEGYVNDGYLYQPVFREVVVTFQNHAGSALNDHKIVFDVAKIKLSTPKVSPAWLSGAQPDTATVGDRYNVALEEAGEHGSVDRGPWGVCSDVGGGEFLGSFLADGILIPQFRNANQIYAVSLGGSGRAWSRRGWDNYPAFMASRTREQMDADIPELGGYGAVEYWRDTFTALGVAGDRLIVERRRQWLSPSVAPDYTNERLEWTVGEYTLTGTWRGKWVWRAIGNVNSTPPIGVTAVDLFQGLYGFEYGNPESLAGDVPGFPSGDTSISNCLADALWLSSRLRYLGHFVFSERRYIESWDVATGETIASREQPVRATLPGFNLQGPGTADVVTYSAAEIRAFPPFPDDYWATPPNNPSNEKTYYPPPAPKEGYVGGTWGERGVGPQVGLYYYEGDKKLVAIFAGGPAISMGLAPSGLYFRSSPLSDGPTWKTITNEDLPPAHIISCYSKIAPGELGQTMVALPWPFDPLSLATDGEKLYFGPRDNSALAMTLTRQGRGLPADAPNHTLPEWDDEVRRVKRFVCWDADSLTGRWEIDALAHVATGTKPYGAGTRLHPCCGDRLGNLVILDAYLLAGIHGADKQLLLEIERNPGGVARTLQLAESALDQSNSGVYISWLTALCALGEQGWCHDSLLAIGTQLYGVTPMGRVWQLTTPD